jgi:hypothetical protein
MGGRTEIARARESGVERQKSRMRRRISDRKMTRESQEATMSEGSAEVSRTTVSSIHFLKQATA